ncbi:MAG: cytotoxic translational repressor of toxin-antitoxin stability system [Candidatus Altiarchaeales archaeon IMC4]|nr:MAG: cytotoxic translational repressor of toxin-antitoxin stability system [Candidatus Altiarchaeales archaeon IMC4]
MTYDVIFSESALRQLKELDAKTQQRIISVLERIRVRPERYIKKLVNDPGYRLRAGDYRVILDIDKNKLLMFVLKIGHRRSIYK